MFSGNCGLVAGATPSTSTSIESLLVAALGSVTPLAAVSVFDPGALGELKE